MPKRIWVGLGFLLMPLAGCDTLGLNDDQEVTLSFATARNGALNSAVDAATDTLRDGTHVLDLQLVDVTFDEIVLERSEDEEGGDSDGDSDSDSDSDGTSNEHFRRGATTVNLPLGGGVITPIDASVPNGTYEEIELDLSQVRLRGTFDGEAFDVTVPVNLEVDVRLDPAFVVDSEADRLNLTVDINALSWLRKSDGSLIDPRQLGSDQVLRAAFVNRIRASIRAFEDSDRDADEADSDSDSDGDRG